MPIINRWPLLWALAACGPAVAGHAPAPEEAGCEQVKAYQHYRRPIYFSIRRSADGFKYKCTLRKNRYRKMDPAAFKRECEAFVNKYVSRLNSCEGAAVSRFNLDQSRERPEKRESERFLKYTGFVHIG